MFSFDHKVLLYHSSSSLLTHFFPFPWPINYDCTFRCHKSSTHSLQIWFWLKISSLSLKLWQCVCPRFIGLKLYKWMKNRLQTKFDAKHCLHIFVGSANEIKKLLIFIITPFGGPQLKFHPNLQFPNGQLLILNFSKVQN